VSAPELRKAALRSKRGGEGADSATAASGTRAGFARRVAIAGADTRAACDPYGPAAGQPDSI